MRTQLENNFMKKILFIEDEAALQESLGEVLEQEGFDVLRATDGQKGLELAQTKNPDLILLDLILPKMDGFEILKRIKADKNTQLIPVIILTNLENAADIGRALELGATTYLVKANYSLDDVLRKVREAIG